MPPNALARISPEVRTLARPQSFDLVAARQEIARNETLQGIFRRARSEGQTPEQLAGALTPELERVLDISPANAVEAAQYLADEYTQIGDSILVIDPETGRALTRIREEDIWVPAPVPREDGTMGQPLPRLTPQLEGLIVSTVYERAKDAQMLERVRARYPETLGLRDAMERRMQPVTRAGRVSMIDEIRSQLPALLNTVQGLSLAFLNHFQELAPGALIPSHLTALPKATAVFQASQVILDPLTFNLNHSLSRALASRIGTRWVGEIALHLSRSVTSHMVVPFEDLDADFFGRHFWIAPPDAFFPLMPYTHTMLPIPGAEIVGLSGIGALVVDPEGFAIQAREVFGRWEVRAEMRYTLYVDPNHLVGLRIPDLPQQDVLAEIV